MLDELGDLLIEFDDVGLLMNEFLYETPLRELRIGNLALRTSSERADKAAEELCRQERLRLRLLDPQNV